MSGLKGESRIQEPTRGQRTIARRAAESKATIPHHYFSAEADVPDNVQTRSSLEVLVVRACALALGTFPLVNASYRDGNFELHPRVNVGVAIEAEDGFAVASLIDADAKPPHAVAAELARLRERAARGELSAAELAGTTFTVHFPGAFGADAAAPIITPPQAATLAAGAVREVAVLGQGGMVARRRMTLTLAADHRILFGSLPPRFLGDVVRRLEEGAP